MIDNRIHPVYDINRDISKRIDYELQTFEKWNNEIAIFIIKLTDNTRTTPISFNSTYAEPRSTPNKSQ